MDFQTFASKETSALIKQLLATQSGAALQQFHAVREALDAAARALATPAHLDQEIQELVGRLTGAAEAEIRRIREEANAALEVGRADLHAQHAEYEKVSATLARTDAEAAILRSELQTAHERTESAERDLALTVNAHTEVEAALRRLEGELKYAHQVKAGLDADLLQAHSTIERLLADVEQLRSLADHQAAEHAALGNEARELRRHRDELNGQLEASWAQVRTLETELSEAHRRGEDRDRIAAELNASGARVQALEREVARAAEVRAQRDALVVEVDARGARIQTLEGDLSTANTIRGQRDALAAELDARSVRIQALEADLAHASRIREQRDALTAELDAGRVRVYTLESDLAQANGLREQRDALVTQAEGFKKRVRELEAEIAAGREGRAEPDTIDVLAAQLQLANARNQSLEEDLASVRALLEARSAQPAASIAEAGPSDHQVDSLRSEVDRMVSLFDASARAVSELAAARDSGELLKELVKRLSMQFSRVALFRVKGTRLEGEDQIGLDESADMSKLVIPTSVDSMLTRVMTSQAVESLHGDDVAVRSGTPFGGSPTSAVALPVVLQGTTLAVIYADDAAMPAAARSSAVHESSVGFARLLVGQVVVLLVRHAHELKTLAELSQYATTLLREAKEMHLADTQAGKKPELVRRRLKDNIECASQLYAYRAAMEGTAAAALLDEQILAELQESTPFATDLAAVLGEMTKGDLRVTAEAS